MNGEEANEEIVYAEDTGSFAASCRRIIGASDGVGLSLGRATISDYLRRADVAGLAWPLPDDLSDGDLERMLFPRTAGEVSGSYPQPDWAYIHSELCRKGVTLSLLWEEYRSAYRDGYGYSRFCELYTRWEGRLSPVMRQRHPAGERLFVDYANPGLKLGHNGCGLPSNR